MFYLLLKNYDDNSGIQEDYVCFEANSKEEAIERAEWFGINLDGRVQDYPTWEWHIYSERKPSPMVHERPLNNLYYSNWLIIYRNNSIETWRDDQLRREIA